MGNRKGPVGVTAAWMDRRSSLSSYSSTGGNWFSLQVSSRWWANHMQKGLLIIKLQIWNWTNSESKKKEKNSWLLESAEQRLPWAAGRDPAREISKRIQIKSQLVGTNSTLPCSTTRRRGKGSRQVCCTTAPSDTKPRYRCRVLSFSPVTDPALKAKRNFWIMGRFALVVLFQSQ